MENNSTETKRMDYFDRIRIFASYIGASVTIKRHAFKKEQWGTLIGLTANYVQVQGGDPNKPEIFEAENIHAVIELKPLGGISNTEAIEIARMGWPTVYTTSD